MNLKDEVKNRIANFVTDDRIIFVYLLGSVQKGCYRDDIDLALIINPGEKFSTLERVNLANELSYIFNRTVDIGLVSTKNMVYTAEVIFSGELIYTKDIDVNDAVCSNLAGLYGEFCDNRKELLDAYRAGN